MRILEDLIKSLKLDVYPYRTPIIALWITFIIAVIVGYYAFVK